MRKSVFSAQYYSMPYLLPPQGNHLSAELQFKEMVVMKHHRDQHEVCTWWLQMYAKTSTELGSFPFHPASAINAAMQFQNAKLFTLDFGPQTADENENPSARMFFLHSGLWTLDESPNPLQNNYYSPLRFQCLAKGSGAQALKTTFLQTLFGNLWRRVMKWWNAWSAQELGSAPPWASKRKLGQFLHQLGQLLTFIGRIKTAPQAASSTTHPKLHRSKACNSAIQLPQIRRPVPAGDILLKTRLRLQRTSCWLPPFSHPQVAHLQTV